MNIKRLVIFVCLILSTLGCDKVFTLSDPVTKSLSFAEFAQLPGFKLDYDLYLPSHINYWSHVDEFKFTFDANQQIYWLKNIELSRMDEKSPTLDFKISNVDWHHQFGFGHMRVNPDESVYSVTASDGVVFQLIYSSNASNLSLELPHNTQAKYVSFAVKITNSELKPSALLYTQLSQTPL
ncbi:hypothetical protein C2869_10990 [Saccharobesus litoralis]|uniref:Uncharacterized protein n=1 Tax=Saccharobesus litoralis TaxID=2172099 RepID=A0A2S0VRT9_9ALTE|nr:hypothetical protein [Saccharobesus litoralis]AWB66928.1 hypothetical protein C2869_10990 [Saccharobesus litoralis]